MARVGDDFLQAPSHGGRMPAPARLTVVHTLECEAKEGLAKGLNNGAGTYLWTGGVSPHTMTDPGWTRGACDTDIVGYHIGSFNAQATGAEVTGRASWTRAQWFEPQANKALERQAKALAEQHLAKGWGPETFRWLSLREVADGRTAGFCTHNDVSTAPWPRSPGTNHWDPGPGYPFDVQMVRIRYYAGVLGHWGNDVPAHTIPTSNPSGVGGVEDSWFQNTQDFEWLNMFAEAFA